MTTTTEFEERVARGAALLDEAKPDWVDYIELGDFDILDPCLCTLGQVFNWYSAGCSYFAFTDDGDAERTQHGAHRYGFFENALEGEDTTSPDRLARWHALNDAWVALIQERKAAA